MLFTRPHILRRRYSECAGRARLFSGSIFSPGPKKGKNKSVTTDPLDPRKKLASVAHRNTHTRSMGSAKRDPCGVVLFVFTFFGLATLAGQGPTSAVRTHARSYARNRTCTRHCHIGWVAGACV